MELKLNIYNKREIVKTYTAETYDLMFGTVEDLIALIDFENLNLNDDSSLVNLAMKIVAGGMDIIKPLLKDIFDGLTDDELKHTKVSDLAVILVNVVKFTLEQMGKGINGKN